MIKKVNWPQAFSEVILLLLGAAIALGVDGWNDRRLDRIAEQEYLTSLHTDFEETREQFVSAQRRTEEIRDLNLQLIGWLSRSRGEVPIDSILETGLRPFFVDRFYPVMGTYQDLVNSGRVNLLRSDSLRIALAEFEVSLERLDQTVDEGYNQWNEIQVPFLLERGAFRALLGGEYKGIELPRMEASAALDRLRAEGFTDLLSVSVVAKQDVILHAAGMLDQIDRILRLISEAQEGDG